jgi:hypothetical protein
MVQQDQNRDKIQQEILQIKETYDTAGSGPGQNTAGDTPDKVDIWYSRIRAGTKYIRRYSR